MALRRRPLAGVSLVTGAALLFASGLLLAGCIGGGSASQPTSTATQVRARVAATFTPAAEPSATPSPSSTPGAAAQAPRAQESAPLPATTSAPAVAATNPLEEEATSPPPEPTSPPPTATSPPSPTQPTQPPPSPTQAVAPAFLSAPQFSVSPTRIRVGSVATGTGSGFTPNSLVKIIGGSGILNLELTSVRADADGSFEVSDTIPSIVGAGSYTITARDSAGRSASVQVTIVR